jgi:3-dehydro-L-gulonate-6-phosphate decarboxylase
MAQVAGIGLLLHPAGLDRELLFSPVIALAPFSSIGNRMAFEAGASWVSVVAGASLTTIERVCQVAREFNGEVQIELGESYDRRQAQAWRHLGVRHVVVHRSRDAEVAGTSTWQRGDLDRVDELAALGFTVTVTGGVSAAELPVFASRPVGIVIVGRALVRADRPADAAAELRQAVAEVWP